MLNVDGSTAMGYTSDETIDAKVENAPELTLIEGGKGRKANDYFKIEQHGYKTLDGPKSYVAAKMASRVIGLYKKAQEIHKVDLYGEKNDSYVMGARNSHDPIRSRLSHAMKDYMMIFGVKGANALQYTNADSDMKCIASDCAKWGYVPRSVANDWR